jgi:hypothetical protein
MILEMPVRRYKIVKRVREWQVNDLAPNAVIQLMEVPVQAVSGRPLSSLCLSEENAAFRRTRGMARTKSATAGGTCSFPVDASRMRSALMQLGHSFALMAGSTGDSVSATSAMPSGKAACE